METIWDLHQARDKNMFTQANLHKHFRQIQDIR